MAGTMCVQERCFLFVTCPTALSRHAKLDEDIAFSPFSLKSCQPVESVVAQSAEITWTHHFLGFWTGLLNQEPPAERAEPCWSVFTRAAQQIGTQHHMVTFKCCREEEGEKKNQRFQPRSAVDSLYCHSSIFRVGKLLEQHDGHHGAPNLSTESLDNT